MRAFRYCSVLLSLLFIFSCNAVTTRRHVQGRSLCDEIGSGERVLVLWQSAWRVDQKEPLRREAIAEKSLARFFAGGYCLAGPGDKKELELAGLMHVPAAPLSDTETEALAAKSKADFVLVITLFELGPNVMINCSPFLWETKNEVEFNIRLVDIRSKKTAFAAHQRYMRGGPFTFNSVDSLGRDVQAALQLFFDRKQ